MSGWTAGSRDTSCLFWHKRRGRPLRSSWSLQWTHKGKRQPALWQQGVQALTGNIPSSGVGVEQPKDVRMDKPIGANGTWLCHGARGCGRERACLCTGEEDCPGLLTARSSLPRLLGQHSDSTGCCRSQQSKGDLQPSSPSLLVHSLQPWEGHESHLGNCALVFCVAAVWFVFSPCPYSVHLA